MSLEDEFHEAMLDLYQRAGREVGHWSNYFLRDVRARGGVVYAKRMLAPQREGRVTKGLQAVIDAGRPDLTFEALVLQPRFASLFNNKERRQARRNLSAFPAHVRRRRLVSADSIYPETMPPNRRYAEGAVRQVLINAYERNPRARAACLRHHGSTCAVCRLSFERQYGPIGRGFIHVHHRKPVAAERRGYRVNPIEDLVPVCPNCHAMLHTEEPPLSVAELQGAMARAQSAKRGRLRRRFR